MSKECIKKISSVVNLCPGPYNISSYLADVISQWGIPIDKSDGKKKKKRL